LGLRRCLLVLGSLDPGLCLIDRGAQRCIIKYGKSLPGPHTVSLTHQHLLDAANDLG
jgi:hypothetical protein